MKDNVDEKPASHVAVDLSDPRVDGLWSRVSAQLGPQPRPGRTPRRPWVLAAGVLGAAAAAVAIAVGTGQVGHEGRVESAAWEGDSLESGARALAVRLGDGSELELDPASRVEVGARTPSAVRLLLKRGRLGCDVTHRPGRSFVVVAEGVEVRVVGTRFSVATEQGRGSARVEVQVERGVVEVRGAGAAAEVVRVEAGRGWSQVIGGEPPGQGKAREEAVADDPPAPTTVPAPDRRPPSVAASSRAGAARSVSSTKAAPSPVNGPRELLGQAREQWRRGSIQDAANTYQTLLTEFPSDGRAGLAAFELGRLRMDRLGDLPGAARALERAVALAPGSEFREDAMARLVAAHAGAHDLGACLRARDQYLVEFPRGVHRRTVAAACR